MERVYSEPSVKIVTVTPEYAQELLDKMAPNRKLRPSKRAQYEGDMNEDQWHLTGQGITVDWFDRTIDGEHRLRSVVASGQTCEMVVLFGADPGSRAAIDDGVKRKFSDDLAMSGQTESYQSAALMRRIAYWENVASRNEGRGGLAGVGHYWKSRTLLNNMWADREKEILAAVKAANKARANFPGNSGALVFMMWLLKDENPATVERFFSIIANGSQDPEDRPLIQVRQAISGNVSWWKKDRRQTGLEYEVFYMLRGWNAWLRREKLVRLSLGKGGLTNPYPKLERTR